MKDAGDFWLNLARMADCYNSSGTSAAERASAAVRQFEQMPPVARREVLEALRSAAYQLPDLYSIVASKSNGQEHGRTREASKSG